MVRFYRNNNVFWSWIEIKICFSVEVYKDRKKSIHIFSLQRICRSLLLQCLLMIGLCINIQIFWVSFLWAHFLVKKFLRRIKKQLEEPFLPFSENIWSPSPAPYKSYTKEKKKKNPHEDKGEKWLWYLIILYWSARVNCLKKEKLEKFSMFQWKRVLLFFMFFHVLYRRGRLVLFLWERVPPPPPPLITHTHTPYTGTYIGRWYKD